MPHFEYYTIILLTAMVLDSSLAFFVMKSNHRNPVNQSYAALSASIFLWQLTNVLHIYTNAPNEASIYIAKWVFFSGIFIGVWLIYFFYCFSYERHSKKRLLINLGIILLLAPIIFSDGIFTGNFFENGKYQVGWFYSYYVLLLITLLIGGLIQLLIPYKKAHPRKKNQIRILFAAFTISIVISGYTHLLYPFILFLQDGEYTYPTGIGTIGPAASFFMTLLLSYTILRHRLLGIRWLLRRKSFPAILAVISTLLTTGTLFTIQPTVTPFFKILILSCTFFLSYSIAKKIVAKFIKKQVIDLYKLGAKEKELLSRCKQPDDLARALHVQFLKRIPVESFILIAYDHRAVFFRQIYPADLKHQYSMEDDLIQRCINEQGLFISIEDTTQMTVPLHANNRLVGILLLGERIDQQNYSEDDLTFLENFQQESADSVWSLLQLEHAVLSRIDDPVLVEDTLSKMSAA